MTLRSTVRAPFVLSSVLSLGAAASLGGCEPRDVGAVKVSKGGACELGADPANSEAKVCADGYVCEPVGGQDGHVCASPIVIRGQVIDALSQAPLAGALVIALDVGSAPVSDVAVADAAGNYELAVSALRDADGELADDAIYTLSSFAADYVPFPAGVRPALPVRTTDAMIEQVSCGDADGDGEADLCDQAVISNPTTVIGLIPLPPGERGGATIKGKIVGEKIAGALVVAEDGGEAAPYGLTDLRGEFTIFNVPAGSVTVRGYRAGYELMPASVAAVAGSEHSVELAVIASGEALASVSGSVSIVNGGGSSLTSVVLVPSSVFNTNLERGPVPYGLRSPAPGLAPDVSGAFVIPGAPAGTYKVLAAFENDGLVRDPDTSIGGTALQEISVVAGQSVAVDAGFKVTGALAVESPGKDAPEAVEGAPTFVFEDDTSEDRYHVVVYDALGDLIWEDAAVPAVSGSPTVSVPYGGPALISGMWYQFRATSWRDKGGDAAISRTEDLRGVFFLK
jgi:hypothetical protein